MKLQFLEKKKEKIVLLLEDTTPYFANLIRRIIIEEVPVMAIEDVEFRKNSSVLYDEMIAHRLGLIPLKTDLDSYNLREKCVCNMQGCDRCTAKVILKAKCEKNSCTVYASDLKFKDTAIKAAFPNMPIVNLQKGQDIELEATAILGRGKEHAKWSAAHAFYKYKPEITIVKQPENAEEIAKICPPNVYEFKNKKLVIKNLLACHLCGACVDAAENGKIKLNETSDSFVFTIESFGQLECLEILLRAAELIAESMDELIEKLK